MSANPVVGIVGAGLMGHGIAQRFLSAGFTVNLYDPSEDALIEAKQQIPVIFNLLGQTDNSGDRLTCFTTLQPAVEDASLVIEAGPENIDVKRQIFSDLCQYTSKDCILATNTSAIPIANIAEEQVKPERIVGAHFWNPPHLVDLVEVIQSRFTDAQVVEETIAIFNRAGLKAVHVKKDIPGFIGNRLQHAMKREAIALVSNGVCDADTIDEVVKHGFGKRLAVLGPLEQSDMVGLDLTLSILSTIYPDLDNSQVPQSLLQDKVAEGKTGMKTGEGFKRWTKASAQQLKQRVQEHLIRAQLQKHSEN
ncbi:3-hydroxyacyl-CoA dehydrogenase family protein [Alteromonas sp. 14N.309.X.WAT.G.H12]|uniref:3-hydroxyacyl-CoA dehydrogenase family protein n=1 Tax=Alteromonas sp. 14N.309.X.WAT.G.H12 TaxID=3120824 RepID=UPI002FD6E1AB